MLNLGQRLTNDPRLWHLIWAAVIRPSYSTMSMQTPSWASEPTTRWANTRSTSFKLNSLLAMSESELKTQRLYGLETVPYEAVRRLKV